jgi:hypothetical protein
VASTLLPTQVRQFLASESERFRIGAGFFLVFGAFCSVFGLALDFNWHTDVGPDTFFTLPHLVLYSGVAIGGVTCLVAVLYSTWTYRQGHSLFPEHSLTPLFGGAFRAPSSFIVGGFAVVLFFFYGWFDEVWHRVYGFDVTVLSPPHIGLMLSMFINVAVAIAVFMSVKAQWPKLFGVTLTVATLLTGTVTTLQASARYTNVSPEVIIALFFTFGFMLVASSVRQPGAVMVTALAVTLFQTLCWYTVPAITQRYADTLGLFLRDDAKVYSVQAAATPLLVLLAAGVLETLLWWGRSRHLRVRPTIVLAGIVFALFMASPAHYLYNTKPILQGNLSVVPPLRHVIVLVPGAALTSYAAWLLGSVLRKSAVLKSHALLERKA